MILLSLLLLATASVFFIPTGANDAEMTFPALYVGSGDALVISLSLIHI